MKKSNTAFLRKLPFVGVLFANFKSSRQKSNKAEKDLEETSAALDKAIAEFLADINKTRLNSIVNAHENAKSCADFGVIKFTYLGHENQN